MLCAVRHGSDQDVSNLKPILFAALFAGDAVADDMGTQRARSRDGYISLRMCYNLRRGRRRGEPVMKMLLVLAVLWLLFGAAGGIIIDRQRPVTLRDVALGPITLAEEVYRA